MNPAFLEAAEQLHTQGYIEDRVRQQLSPQEYQRLTDPNQQSEED